MCVPADMKNTGDKETVLSSQSSLDESMCTNANATTNSTKTSVNKNEYALNFAFGSFFGFTIVQFFFSLIAGSQSLMTDCAAQCVDIATYLINCCAERMKNRTYSRYELSLPVEARNRRRKLQTLFLELVPPMISVVTLLVVTIMALRDAFVTILSKDDGDDGDDPNLHIMLGFSGFNLILDIVSVSCFTQAEENQGSGLFQLGPTLNSGTTDTDNKATVTETSVFANENTHLLATTVSVGDVEDGEVSEVSDDNAKTNINLNMCSALTHILADTMRSIAVLLAAGFSFLFPSILSASDADSWGAVVVSIIIIVSLAPLLQGLYFTAIDIRDMLIEENKRRRQQEGGKVTSISV